MLSLDSSVENRDLTALDLFSGCGGMTVGLKEAGFQVLGAVDIDRLSVETYQANHEDVKKVWRRDIKNLNPSEVVDMLGLKDKPLDLLAGCPPCQGFSTIRTLNGKRSVDDPRNDLLFEFFRFVEALRPRAVMMENVPGLAKDDRFAIFLRRMKNLGYLGEPHVLDVAEYGVPQRRKRLIYLPGYRKEISLAKPIQKKRTVRDAIGNLPPAGSGTDPVHDMAEKRTPRIMEIIRHIPKDGGSRTDLPEQYQLDCHKRCEGFKDVYGRMAWDKVAPTITSGCSNPSKGRFLHPEEDRAITLREAALLQGFSRSYKLPSTNKSSVALMIGNALPPPFIAAHARCVSDALTSSSCVQQTFL